jgi:hypothetical protein
MEWYEAEVEQSSKQLYRAGKNISNPHYIATASILPMMIILLIPVIVNNCCWEAHLIDLNAQMSATCHHIMITNTTLPCYYE